MDIKKLNRDFGITGQLEFVDGPGGLPFINISNQRATAIVSIYGAQVLSFQPIDQTEDVLFLSQQSAFTEGKAIRGGIPVCWPWFGTDPKGLNRPNHGFARNHCWQVVRTEAVSVAETRVSLVFTESLKTERTWMQPFKLVLDIRIGSSLSLNLTTHNTGNQPFSITQALHTYFKVGDIQQLQIFGLEGCEYFDKLDQGRLKNQQQTVTIDTSVDRIYTDVQSSLRLVDPVYKRRIRIVSSNTKTAVVWNPWVEMSRNMSDLADADYKNFVCVEAGNIAFDLVQVLPGKQSSLSVSFSLDPLPE